MKGMGAQMTEFSKDLAKSEYVRSDLNYLLDTFLQQSQNALT